MNAHRMISMILGAGLFLTALGANAQNDLRVPGGPFGPGGPDNVPPPFDDFSRLVPASCNSCGTSMAGEWTYTTFDQGGNIGAVLIPITFTLFGAYFWGHSDTLRIIGEVRGKWIRLTMTVFGEEGDGWVGKAEGSIHTYPDLSGFTLGTLVSQDSWGQSGSFILRRAP